MYFKIFLSLSSNFLLSSLDKTQCPLLNTSANSWSSMEKLHEWILWGFICSHYHYLDRFTWFSLLPANSIIKWADLEKQFHKYFFIGVREMRLTNLRLSISVTTNLSRTTSRDSGILRADALACLSVIANWQSWLSKECCLTTRRSSPLKNLRVWAILPRG